MNANWNGHILHRNCLSKHSMEGKTEGRTLVIGRRGRRCKQLLDALTETRVYWEEKTLDQTLWRTCFGRGYGSHVKQTMERVNSIIIPSTSMKAYVAPQTV